MQSLARRLAVLDLRPSEASILMVIEANPDIRQSAVGRVLDIAGANMAPLVTGLAKRKLVERQPVDGRSNGLTLSRQGRRVCVRVRKIMKAHEEALLARIPPAHRKAFMAVLCELWEAKRGA